MILKLRYAFWILSSKSIWKVLCFLNQQTMTIHLRGIRKLNRWTRCNFPRASWLLLSIIPWSVIWMKHAFRRRAAIHWSLFIRKMLLPSQKDPSPCLTVSRCKRNFEDCKKNFLAAPCKPPYPDLETSSALERKTVVLSKRKCIFARNGRCQIRYHVAAAVALLRPDYLYCM